MRFLLLTQYYSPEVGAAQVRLLALARHLRHRGHEVTVVTAMPNYPAGVVRPEYRRRWLVREEIEGIPVIRTWIHPTTGSGVVGRMASYLSFCTSSLVGSLLAAPFDYVLVESPPLFLGGTALVISKIQRAPYVMIISDLWPASARELGIVTSESALRLAERLERFLYRSAFRVAGVTHAICDTVAESIDSAKVMFLPNGVDTSVFRPMNGSWDGLCRHDEIVYLYAGTHGFSQGLDVILETAALVDHRPEIVFLLMGDGPEKARIRRTATARGLSNVRFADPRPIEAMPLVFSAARASIVPLLDRPLFRGARPSKIFPSLACGTPVVYSGEGEAAELIAGTGAGLVVPPERPIELAAAVLRLADDPVLANRMGAAGRDLVEREYSWAGIVERWIADLPARGLPPQAGAA